MKVSKLFSETLREAPSAASEVQSHQLLLRGGYLRQLAAGVFSLLPLGRRTSEKIKQIMREEMNAIDGQEIEMPVINPATIWQETGRWYQIGSEMGRFQDKNGRDMVLAMTHEEVVADLLRQEVQSHKQLPMMIYHIQTKWRDDPRPRAGLIRAREFTMKDSYTLDKDSAGLDAQYQAHYDAYFRIFDRCGLPSIAVEADVGMMGGTGSHEYMYLTPIGEDTLLICDACGLSANQQVAKFRKPAAQQEALRPIEKVETPNMKTIAGLADFLNVPKSRTAKAVFITATILPIEAGGEEVERLVFAIVRGDMELSETKLSNVIRAKEMRPATEEEIVAVGATPGYASPVGLVQDAFMTVVDDAVVDSANLVAGANEAGYHLLNTNVGRDYTADIIGDIAAAQDGDQCPNCGEAMVSKRGVEIGNIFKLGTRYTAAMGAMFTDENGERKPVVMGSYGIGVGRLLACVVEEHNDENGIIWPITIAPYHVHIVSMRGGEAVAEQLYNDLNAAGVETLWDDRDARPGVKFNDADLLGIPLRVTIGARSLKSGGVEFKVRSEQESVIVPIDEAISVISAKAQSMLAALNG
jgi:prolyl-tRNA synthetase